MKGVTQSMRTNGYPIKSYCCIKKYRVKVVFTQYEFYKYPIKKCNHPTNLTFIGKYPIAQKKVSVSLQINKQ